MREGGEVGGGERKEEYQNTEQAESVRLCEKQGNIQSGHDIPVGTIEMQPLARDCNSTRDA